MQKIFFKTFEFSVILFTLGLFLSGCAKQTGDIYRPSEAGKIMQAKGGLILSSREVLISGLNAEETNWGSIIGAVVAGTAAYGLTEGDTALSQAGIIIATIGGAMAGTFVEEKINTIAGHEYIIELDDGKKVALVQAVSKNNPPIALGTYVSIVYSSTGNVRITP